MTTRKALIERIEAMQLGTQEMLDAAADDATLIPFDTLFVSKKYDCVVWRLPSNANDENSIFVAGLSVRDFCDSAGLRPMSED